MSGNGSNFDPVFKAMLRAELIAVGAMVLFWIVFGALWHG